MLAPRRPVPSLDCQLGLFLDNLMSAVLGDQGPVLPDHHHHGDPLHSVLLLQIPGQAGVVLHPVPVTVILLHVGDHVLGAPVARHEDDLQLIRDLSVELCQDGCELGAGGTPEG